MHQCGTGLTHPSDVAPKGMPAWPDSGMRVFTMSHLHMSLELG